MRIVFVVLLLSSCANEPPPAQTPPPPAISQFGYDEGRGNLLGVQPWLTPLDYATPERLDLRVRSWLDVAAQQGFLNERTIVVFPEYMGSWIVAVDEPEDVLTAETIADAMTSLGVAHFADFVGASLSAPAKDASAHAVFAMKAARIAEVYEGIFSGVARDYRVTVVSGSVLLPTPALVDGRLQPGAGAPLQNILVVYGPDGEAQGIVRKVFPTSDEQAFVSAATVDELPIFETPAGTLAVLICADSWYPESYAAVAGAELLAVPVFLAGDWRAPWKGYSGHPAPKDVDVEEDIREDEAWMKYSTPGRARGFRKALNVTLRGEFWDLVDGGQPLVFNGASGERAPELDAPLLVNVWL